MSNTIYPVSGINFRICTQGRTPASEAAFATVRGMENFSISFDNGIEEWTPLDARGWRRRMLTAKSMSIAISGKRMPSCQGNNYIAQCAYQAGVLCESILLVSFPNGDELQMDCVINVTTCGGGGATELAELNFECLSDGVPIYMRSNGSVITPMGAGLELGVVPHSDLEVL
ncbi:MAG: hypothetical protein FWE44_00370 [Defluviitaleaceae bacterium]|nr:hypothetical protein [Defluviitaleaceae bacterium]